MTIPLLADLAALVAADLAWRVSKPIGAAIALAVGASLVHAATGLEALRWSSALVGLVGAAVLVWRVDVRAICQRGRVETDEDRVLVEHYRLGRPDALAVLCLASMAGDGAALLLYRGGWPWVFDAAQILVSAAVIAVCWPRRRT